MVDVIGQMVTIQRIKRFLQEKFLILKKISRTNIEKQNIKNETKLLNWSLAVCSKNIKDVLKSTSATNT